MCDVCAIGAEDVLAAVNQLGKTVKVVSLNPHSLSDIESDIRSVAKAAGSPENAEQLIAKLNGKAEAVRKLTENVQRPRIFCVEWLKPIMNAGHWVPEMVEYVGEAISSPNVDSLPGISIGIQCWNTIPRSSF